MPTAKELIEALILGEAKDPEDWTDADLKKYFKKLGATSIKFDDEDVLVKFKDEKDLMKADKDFGKLGAYRFSIDKKNLTLYIS